MASAIAQPRPEAARPAGRPLKWLIWGFCLLLVGGTELITSWRDAEGLAGLLQLAGAVPTIGP